LEIQMFWTHLSVDAEGRPRQTEHLRRLASYGAQLFFFFCSFDFGDRFCVWHKCNGSIGRMNVSYWKETFDFISKRIPFPLLSEDSSSYCTSHHDPIPDHKPSLLNKPTLLLNSTPHHDPVPENIAYDDTALYSPGARASFTID
jgi:hypothetical protein